VFGSAAFLLAALVCGCAAPAPTPTPAVELVLRTEAGDACPEALLGDVRLEVDPAARDPIVAIAPDGERVRLVFRAGTRAAWDASTGVVHFLTPEQQELAVGPGDTVSFGGGFTSGENGVFFACSFVP
jgi:hypothetical protein